MIGSRNNNNKKLNSKSKRQRDQSRSISKWISNNRDSPICCEIEKKLKFSLIKIGKMV